MHKRYYTIIGSLSVIMLIAAAAVFVVGRPQSKAVKTKNDSYSFDLTLGTQIIDMPAGYYSNTVHNFDGRTAIGTISFTDKNQQKFVGNLDSFNYTAKLNASKTQWHMAQMIACSKSS